MSQVSVRANMCMLLVDIAVSIRPRCARREFVLLWEILIDAGTEIVAFGRGSQIILDRSLSVAIGMSGE